jgi:hypothetical protein
LRLIGLLLWQRDRPHLLVAQLHLEPTALTRDRQPLIPELAHHVDRRPRCLRLRQAQRVRLHLRLDRGAHVGCGPEEAIRRV